MEEAHPECSSSSEVRVDINPRSASNLPLPCHGHLAAWLDDGLPLAPRTPREHVPPEMPWSSDCTSCE